MSLFTCFMSLFCCGLSTLFIRIYEYGYMDNVTRYENYTYNHRLIGSRIWLLNVATFSYLTSKARRKMSQIRYKITRHSYNGIGTYALLTGTKSNDLKWQEYSQRHGTSRGLCATAAELLVKLTNINRDLIHSATGSLNFCAKIVNNVLVRYYYWSDFIYQVCLSTVIVLVDAT